MLIVFLIKSKNLKIIIGNLIILILIVNLINYNWIEWFMIFCNLRFNFYSYGLILLTLRIFGLIFCSLNRNRINCLLINFFNNFVINIFFLSINLFYELGLLLIFYIVVKWDYKENRWLSGFYLIIYTTVFFTNIVYYILYLLNWM